MLSVNLKEKSSMDSDKLHNYISINNKQKEKQVEVVLFCDECHCAESSLQMAKEASFSKKRWIWMHLNYSQPKTSSGSRSILPS